MSTFQKYFEVMSIQLFPFNSLNGSRSVHQNQIAENERECQNQIASQNESAENINQKA